jgi:Domain of unknown function (DUF4430)
MNRKTVIALLGAFVIALVAAGAAAAASTGPAVTVQIKTTTKTLKSAVVHGQRGSITKDGGKCSGDSGAGALNAATDGKWAGKYFGSYHDYEVNSILGVKPRAHYYWELFVDGKSASSGICHVKLKAHETILFKIAKG